MKNLSREIRFRQSVEWRCNSPACMKHPASHPTLSADEAAPARRGLKQLQEISYENVPALGLTCIDGLLHNVKIENVIPFEQILPKVDVFLTNGGFGAVNLALSNGVPMVVAGDTEDKVFTAARVRWTGTGINLETGRSTGEQIRTAVREVLSDKKYRNNAINLRKKFARYNALDLITENVNSLLSIKNSEELFAKAGSQRLNCSRKASPRNNIRCDVARIFRLSPGERSGLIQIAQSNISIQDRSSILTPTPFNRGE
jgi:uncharacterized membrane protein